MASEARSAELTIIVSHLTGASGIIVLFKTPTKYREKKKSVITCRAVVLLHGLFAPCHFAPVTLPPVLERVILYLKLACFGLWLKERGISHIKRAWFALWLIEQGILHIKRAWFALCLIERGILHSKRAK